MGRLKMMLLASDSPRSFRAATASTGRVSRSVSIEDQITPLLASHVLTMKPFSHSSWARPWRSATTARIAHMSNARPYLDTDSGRAPQQEVATRSGTAMPHVHCKIERHQCFYNPNTHAGGILEEHRRVPQLRAGDRVRTKAEPVCLGLDSKCEWYNGSTDPAVRGHNFGTHPIGNPPVIAATSRRCGPELCATTVPS